MRLIDADALMIKLTYSPNGVRYREFDCDNFPSTLTLRAAKKLVREEPTIGPWVKTSDRAPTMEDADAWDLVFATHRAFGGEPYKVRYQVVANNPSDHVWWMPIPPLPEVEE